MSNNLSGLQRYINSLESKAREIEQKTAELGQTTAQSIFDVEAPNYPGAQGYVNVTVEDGAKHGKAVVAAGPKVAFIEFGTGIMYPRWPGNRLPAGIVPHGWYGSGKGASPRGWIYKGEPGNGRYAKAVSKRAGRYWTKGNPPASAMYQAMRDMDEEAGSIAEEVFRRK